MKINNINSQISFGRVIKVNSTSNGHFKGDKWVDSKKMDVVKVLNGYRSCNYSDKEQEQIRTFFKSILGDYNGKNGISIKKLGSGDLFLLSGQDAVNIEKLEKNKYIERRKIKKDKSSSRQARREEISKTFSDVDRIIKLLEENGKPGKAESSLHFSSKNKKYRIDSFTYSCIAQSFSAENDGYRDETKPNKCRSFNNYNLANIVCENKQMTLE